jgi:multicomponent Na+:H+ antiporter subunit G
LLILGLCSFAAAVLGAYRFGFVMNRLHAAGIGDTAGIFLIIASLVVARGPVPDSLKLIVLVFFLWFTSPVSTHFLGQVEYYTNPLLRKYVKKGGLPGFLRRTGSADEGKAAVPAQPKGEKDAAD